MAIEKNVIFIYPLVPVLNELKQSLEKQDDYIIYEIDNVGEFAQLIGIVEHAVTFSSDMKKTSRYLQENKNYVLKEETLCIAVTSAQIPNHIADKLTKFGLDEIAKDSINLKSLQFKVENFFKKFIAKAELLKKQAQRAISDEVTHFKPSQIQESSQKRHIERLMSDEVSLDDNLKGKLKNSGLDDLGGVLQNKVGFKLDETPSIDPLKKKNLQFEQSELKKKHLSFIPVEKLPHAKKGFKLNEFSKAGLKGLALEEHNKEGARGLKLEDQTPKEGLKGLAIEEQKKEGARGLKLEDQTSKEGLKGLALADAEPEGLKVMKLDDITRDGLVGLALDTITRDGIHSLVAENQGDDDQDNSFDELNHLLKKDWGEQTIDYRNFLKKYKLGKEKLTLEQKKELNRKFADKISDQKSFSFYGAQTNGCEYLVHLTTLYLDERKDDLSVLKFIHFALMKESYGVVSFYLQDKDHLVSLYQGHQHAKLDDYNLEKWNGEENDVLMKIKLYEIPTWKDETYQENVNQFIYPYYHDGQKLGVAIAHFKGSIKNHKIANSIEVFFASAKGILQQKKEQLLCTF